MTARPGRLPRRGVPVGLAIVLAFALAADAAGQTVRGRVIDRSNGSPVAGAVVAASIGSRVVATALSDSAGSFALGVPGGDRVALRVFRVGYAAVTIERVDPSDGDDLEIRLLPEPIALDPVTATARQGRMNPAATLEGAYARHATLPRVGPNRVFARSDPEMRGASSVGNLLDRNLIAGGGRARCTDWFLNGIPQSPLTDPADFIRSLPTSIVGFVEYYRDDISAPLELQGKGFCRQVSGGFSSIVAIWLGGP